MASRSRIISAARCNSPTSSATSTRTPRSAASICRSEELRKAGIVTTEPKAVLASAGLGQVCDAVAARALGHFQEADAIMARNPRRTVKAPRIMEEVYRVMLQGMMARGWAPPRTRVSVSRLRLSWIAVQYAII